MGNARNGLTAAKLRRAAAVLKANYPQPREILVIEPRFGGSWGRGPDITTALKKLRRAAGLAARNMPKAYLVFDVPAGTCIDEMGRFVFWPSQNGGDYLPPREIGRVGLKPKAEAPKS